MITTTTSSGYSVTITPNTQEYLDERYASPSFELQYQGKLITGRLCRWIDKQSAVHCERVRGAGFRTMGLTIPKPIFEEAMEKSQEIVDEHNETLKQRKQDIRDGRIKIEISWRVGSPLSAWVCSDRQAKELLAEIGMTRDISGWGTAINNAMVAELGESFSYADAVEFCRPRQEKKEAADRKAKEDREAIFAKAKATGEKQALRSWTDDCDGSACDCSFDSVTEWAMPEGTTTTTRVHCH